MGERVGQRLRQRPDRVRLDPVPRRRPRPVRRRRPWDAVSWWYSLILVIPLLIVGYIAMGGISFGSGGSSRLVIHVSDRFTGQALAGAQVLVGDRRLVTDRDGKATTTRPNGAEVIEVRHGQYAPMWGQLDRKSAADQNVALRPTVLQGTVSDTVSGRPIEGATVSVFAANGSHDAEVRTDARGHYQFAAVPENARVHIDAGEFGTAEETVGQRTRIDFKLKTSVVTGTVANAAGQPIQGAVVSAGSAQAVSGADGTYRLTGAPTSGQVMIQASGYETLKLPLSATQPVNAKLQAVTIKGIHVNAATAGNADRFGHLVDLEDRTELNAMVIDIKEGSIFFDSDIQFFRDAGVVQPMYNVQELLKTLHAHHIYAIARMTVFYDPLVAAHYPDLAVKDVTTGGVWHDSNGDAWVNPRNKEIWQPNIDLAVEAAKLGFDEVQFDYIRFPTTGNLKQADYGPDFNEETRVATITGFLKAAVPAIHEAGAKVSLDILGITALYDDDQGVGQRFRDIAPLVDYICPMVYPSLYDPTAIDVGGDPYDHPYEVVKLSLAGAKAKMAPGTALKLRPWLEDYSDSGKRDYTAADVLAQIKATDEAGASGWQIWNDGSDYHEDVFKPQT